MFTIEMMMAAGKIVGRMGRHAFGLQQSFTGAIILCCAIHGKRPRQPSSCGAVWGTSVWIWLKMLDPDETRTRNLLIRSQTPYPLGHEDTDIYQQCSSAYFIFVVGCFM